MRYQLGQVIPMIAIHFTRKDGEPSERNNMMNGLFRPWEDTLDEIVVLPALVTEHHKTYNGWDPNKRLDYDGYVLKARNGSTWHNQYPTASDAGQLDDSNNYNFSIHINPEYTSGSIEIDAILNAGVALRMEDGLQRLARVRRFYDRKTDKLNFGEGSRDWITDEIITRAREFHDALVEKIEEAVGRKIVATPLTFDREGETIDMSDHGFYIYSWAEIEPAMQPCIHARTLASITTQVLMPLTEMNDIWDAITKLTGRVMLNDELVLFGNQISDYIGWTLSTPDFTWPNTDTVASWEREHGPINGDNALDFFLKTTSTNYVGGVYINPIPFLYPPVDPVDSWIAATITPEFRAQREAKRQSNEVH